jgi:hypothetical protein
MPCPSSRSKLLSRRPCPRQNTNCQGQKFCPRWKRQFLSFKILSKWLFLVEYPFLIQEKSFLVFLQEKINLLAMDKNLSWTILILSWTKWPGQKFCPVRRMRHKCTNYEGIKVCQERWYLDLHPKNWVWGLEWFEIKVFLPFHWGMSIL